MPSRLTGRKVLIVEDESLIAFDLASTLEDVGARAVTAETLGKALDLIQHEAVVAAVIDHVLPDGESCDLREKLRERGIPVVVYTGAVDVQGHYSAVIQKPATPDRLVEKLERLLDDA